MGLCPPQNFGEVSHAFMDSDNNKDGRISRCEMFNFFKKVQRVNAGCL